MARKINRLWVTIVATLAMIFMLCVGANAEETAKTAVLVDESFSSSNFKYEPYLTEYLKDSQADIIRFGEHGKTKLYDQVQQSIDDGYRIIYIISDCWNTAGRTMVEQNNNKIVLLTPYFKSDDVDAHLYKVERELNSSVPIEVYYWSDWPMMKRIPHLEPETDPDEDPMYRPTEVDEDVLENLATLSDEKDVAKTANTLNNAILEDMEIPRESYILGDCSGSMAAFQEDVLQKVQVSEGRKYVFAESSEEFSENKSIWDYDIGGATDIVGAINVALKEAPKDAHLYLLSDLEDNCGGVFDEDICNSFEGIVTIVYYSAGDDYGFGKDFIEKMQMQMPKATFEIC